MKKNARYVGGSGTGVELTLPLTDNQQRRVTVAPGEALREDFGGVRVDPDFIERLLETDQWELVGDPPANVFGTGGLDLSPQEKDDIAQAITDGEIGSDDELARFVADASIQHILDDIDGDRVYAKRALAAELARGDNPRRGLIDGLTKVITAEPDNTAADAANDAKGGPS